MAKRNYDALLTPVTRDEIAAFKRDIKTGLGSNSFLNANSTLPDAIQFVMLSLFAIAFSAFMVFLTVGDLRDSQGWFGQAFITVIILGVTGAWFYFAIRGFLAKRPWGAWLQLSRFAKANDLVFATNTPAPSYAGSIFQQGNARLVPEHLYRRDGSRLDLGNYRYTTGSGKNRTTHHWGFIAIPLDRMMPQMVLDAKSNNFIGSNLPLTFSRDQILGLEGDFDRYFTLYCPRKYERDALYVFTPDLMELLIDEVARFDVEIIDDWMFVYSAKPFNLADPHTLLRLFEIIDTVGAKTRKRTTRYADSKLDNSANPSQDRMSQNFIAPQGRRLKRGIPLTLIIVTAVAAAIYLLPRLMGAL